MKKGEQEQCANIKGRNENHRATLWKLLHNLKFTVLKSFFPWPPANKTSASNNKEYNKAHEIRDVSGAIQEHHLARAIVTDERPSKDGGRRPGTTKQLRF